MIQPILANQTWLSFTLSTRGELRKIFELPRSGHVEVMGSLVICDGTMAEDLEHLTTEKMQKYLGSPETDFYKLLTMVIEMIEHPEVSEIDTTLEVHIPATDIPQTIESVETRKEVKIDPLQVLFKKPHAKTKKGKK